MLKNLAQLEIEIEKKICRFTCDNDTPTHYIKEALFQFQRYVGAIEESVKQQQEADKAQENVPEETKPDITHEE